ncbi:hypothetical protein BB934_26215 [Microvirga ossetica]|uniref:Uncharacterized protein n=1 Tax=Microvirga ossetica TaxID=1882682 RepID=A0A1B2EMU7_9HYPH|nr:hypothetical protein [Microvirga ossetica]ANY81281.1 hypothetical protein BB934_26215 [Microvirga ossetica]
MGPFTIDHTLIATLERLAQSGSSDEVLVTRVQSEVPQASRLEVARAALYIATDPTPTSSERTERMYSLSRKLRRAA